MPYFSYFLIAIFAVYAFFIALSVKNKKLSEKLKYSSLFYAVLFLILAVLNLIIAKFALLPVLYFPSFDKILGVIVKEHLFLLKCVGYSARLLAYGFFGGAILGFITGVSIGFSKTMSYWLSPVIHLVGPMPSTAWIPILLVIFPTVVSTSAVLIGIAVWFPVALMTASGIANISQTYFDAGKILGAGRFKSILFIGIPAAAPHIFLGVFNGTCMSFITLVVAELIGAKYGIGWYINWQKDMLAYANVYAGLIIIAVCFYLLVTGLFKLRDRVLTWQKGTVKW
ncbi:ABC transporter permease [Fibrobacterales bacterium]|nr:ABC transporter permease [Fibrobacterales bacterium]